MNRYIGRGELVLKHGGRNFPAGLISPYLARGHLSAAQAFDRLCIRNRDGFFGQETMDALDALAPCVQAGAVDFSRAEPDPLDFEEGEKTVPGDRFRIAFDPKEAVFRDVEAVPPLPERCTASGTLYVLPRRYEELPTDVLYGLKHLFFVTTVTRDGYVSRMELSAEDVQYREGAVLAALDAAAPYLTAGSVRFTGDKSAWEFWLGEPVCGGEEQEKQWFYRGHAMRPGE